MRAEHYQIEPGPEWDRIEADMLEHIRTMPQDELLRLLKASGVRFRRVRWWDRFAWWARRAVRSIRGRGT